MTNYIEKRIEEFWGMWETSSSKKIESFLRTSLQEAYEAGKDSIEVVFDKPSYEKGYLAGLEKAIGCVPPERKKRWREIKDISIESAMNMAKHNEIWNDCRTETLAALTKAQQDIKKVKNTYEIYSLR